MPAGRGKLLRWISRNVTKLPVTQRCRGPTSFIRISAYSAVAEVYSCEGSRRADWIRQLFAHLAISVFMGSTLSHFRQAIVLLPVLAVIAIKRFLHFGQRLTSIKVSLRPATTVRTDHASGSALSGCQANFYGVRRLQNVSSDAIWRFY